MRKSRLLVMALALLALGATNAAAQGRRLIGRVTEAGSGTGIGSASVSVVGTTVGATTDADGRFNFVAPEGTLTLRVRRIGYAPKVTTVNAGLSDVVVSLDKDVLQPVGHNRSTR